ncbi:MATE family efflux transporter [Halioxenophilus sp. WMMB6]|uniref:MATE family efflux transporter n=1 Tax=Halioxenophilus sp. WMMB6 TaxID=3073815 RepID=UPI00295EED68|nr:MATE family efflux transporter [Halioxenophilus sp. WMMB6]
MKQPISFTQGPVGKVLYQLALPGVIGLGASMSFNIADTFFVGRLGSESLAAMSFTFPIVLLITTLGIGFATGTSSVYARMLGLKMPQEARQMAGDTLLLCLAISTTVMMLGWQLMEPTFQLLGAKPALLPLINQYMWAWYWNTPFFCLSMVISAILQASGHNKIAGTLMIWSAIANIILDPILIFGLGPIPGLAIAGAAWTTVFTRVLLTGLALYLAIHRYQLISIPHLRGPAMLRSWRAVMKVGVPTMATNLIIPIFSGAALVLVSSFGPEAVAAMGITQRLEPLLLIVLIGLANILGPFVGQNMVPEHRARLPQALAASSRFSLVYGLVCALLLWLCGGLISKAFTDSARVISIAATYLAIVPLSYGLQGISMAANSSFNGLGKPLPGAAISALRVLVIFVPLALLGKYWFGLVGIFVAVALANSLAGIIGYFWLRQTYRKATLQSI